MITLQFDDFEEMTGFARKLLGNIPAPATAPVQQPVAPVPTVPTTALPVQQPVVPAPTVPAASPMAPSPVQPPVPAPPVAPPPVVPTSVQTYTTDDLARAAMALMDSGRQEELLGLLTSFGVDALPSLPQAQYGAFATALRGMGAQI